MKKTTLPKLLILVAFLFSLLVFMTMQTMPVQAGFTATPENTETPITPRPTDTTVPTDTPIPPTDTPQPPTSEPNQSSEPTPTETLKPTATFRAVLPHTGRNSTPNNRNNSLNQGLLIGSILLAIVGLTAVVRRSNQQNRKIHEKNQS